MSHGSFLLRGPHKVALAVALVVLFASAVGFGTIVSSLRLQLTKLPIQAPGGVKFHTLPKEFEGWKTVRDEVMSADAQIELGTDNYVTRWYIAVDDKGKTAEPQRIFQLHCAYYTGMIDTVPHVPERCMTGGGMEFAGETQTVKVPLDLTRFALDPDFPPTAERGRVYTARSERMASRVRLPLGIENLEMRVTPFRDSQAKHTLWAGYFFMANGGVVASANDVRLLAFRLHDDYAYYAKVQFMSADVGSAEELAALAAEVLHGILPDIMRCVPDWMDVEEGLYPADNPRRKERLASTPNR